ncbi:MAG: TIGR01906 family membrane protein [Clostridia bacterium]
MNKILTIVFIVALMFLIITFSIGLPIYVRPFYYAQIEPLNIENDTGFSKAEIKNGYDEVMDYLVAGKEFGTGVFKYSDSGKSHFEDCKTLFDLNIIILIASGIIVATLLILNKLKKIEFLKFKGFHPMFFASIILIVTLLFIGFLVSLDFYRAFEIFHKIFFPGKGNWIFDYRTDEIILALPSQFFLNCGILILVSIVLISAVLVAVSIINKRKEKAKV